MLADAMSAMAMVSSLTMFGSFLLRAWSSIVVPLRVILLLLGYSDEVGWWRSLKPLMSTDKVDYDKELTNKDTFRHQSGRFIVIKTVCLEWRCRALQIKKATRALCNCNIIYFDLQHATNSSPAEIYLWSYMSSPSIFCDSDVRRQITLFHFTVIWNRCLQT